MVKYYKDFYGQEMVNLRKVEPGVFEPKDGSGRFRVVKDVQHRWVNVHRRGRNFSKTFTETRWFILRDPNDGTIVSGHSTLNAARRDLYRLELAIQRCPSGAHQ